MGNKNTNRIRAIVRKDGKAKIDEVVLDVPASGYHNEPKGRFAKRRIPTARRGANGVVSSNARRNTAMVVAINEDAKGRKDSITTHESLKSGIPTSYKNHSRAYAAMTAANKR